ncbi:hypothetical protein ACVIGB_001038 [Bradyrhizobium sp. USDA 4341]
MPSSNFSLALTTRWPRPSANLRVMEQVRDCLSSPALRISGPGETLTSWKYQKLLLSGLTGPCSASSAPAFAPSTAAVELPL